MKNLTITQIILFGFGTFLGILSYGYFSSNGIDWVKAVSVGVICMIVLFIVMKISNKRHSNQA